MADRSDHSWLIGIVAWVGGQGSGRFSGRFWLPAQPAEHVGGWLDLSARWPVLELAEPLTSALREGSRTTFPDGSVRTRWQPVDDDVQPEGLTIHGVLRRGPARAVTLVGRSPPVEPLPVGGSATRASSGCERPACCWADTSRGRKPPSRGRG